MATAEKRRAMDSKVTSHLDPVGSPGRGCLMLEGLKHPMIPGTSLMMCPERYQRMYYSEMSCQSAGAAQEALELFFFFKEQDTK